MKQNYFFWPNTNATTLIEIEECINTYKVGENIESDIYDLSKLRKEYPNNPIISYLNINSVIHKINRRRGV